MFLFFFLTITANIVLFLPLPFKTMIIQKFIINHYIFCIHYKRMPYSVIKNLFTHVEHQFALMSICSYCPRVPRTLPLQRCILVITVCFFFLQLLFCQFTFVDHLSSWYCSCIVVVVMYFEYVLLIVIYFVRFQFSYAHMYSYNCYLIFSRVVWLGCVFVGLNCLLCTLYYAFLPENFCSNQNY